MPGVERDSSSSGRPGLTPMVEQNPTPEQISAYRDALDRLMARCIGRVTSFALAEEAEPLGDWRPGD